MDSNNLLEDKEVTFMFVFCIIFLPSLLSASYVYVYLSWTDVIAGFICGLVMVMSYGVARRLGRSSQVSVITAVLVLIPTVFIISVYTLSEGQNPFEYYLPYLGGLSAWAFPTIMWQETRWFLNSDRVSRDIPSVIIETVGFTVALIYSTSYVLYDLYGKGADSAPILFFGFVMMWGIIRVGMPVAQRNLS